LAKSQGKNQMNQTEIETASTTQEATDFIQRLRESQKAQSAEDATEGAAH